MAGFDILSYRSNLSPIRWTVIGEVESRPTPAFPAWAEEMQRGVCDVLCAAPLLTIGEIEERYEMTMCVTRAVACEQVSLRWRGEHIL